MGIETIALTVGLAGLATQGVSAVQQAGYRKDQTAASRRAEALREQQAELEAARRNREAFRKQMVANALSTTRSVSQGGSLENSALGGAFGQAAGTTGRDVLFNEQSLEIGQGLFRANADIAEAQGNIATWEGVGKLGSSLVTNSQMIGQIGTTMFGPQANQRSFTPTSGTNSLDVLPGAPY